MKYIRTKFGRVFKVDSEYGKHFYKVEVPEFFAYTLIDKSDVVKTSDNVEKLIDGFIIGETLKIYNKSNFDFEKKMVNLGQKYWTKFENLKSIYGVVMVFDNDIPKIRTVAKMNEEGELVLL